ncbi:Uncharacterised protein [Vibrio cholerae]|nr:Uncharacterised protein [Vibrio cholerae]
MQYPQQFRLQIQIHFADLIEQNGATLGLFKLTGTRLYGSGKRAFFITE